MRLDRFRPGFALIAAMLGLSGGAAEAGWEGDFSIPRGCNRPVEHIERMDASRVVLLGEFSLCGGVLAPDMVGYNFSMGRFYKLGVAAGAHADETSGFTPLVAESDGAGKVYLADLDNSSRLVLARIGADNVLEWIVASGGLVLSGEPADMDFAPDGSLYIATAQGVIRGVPGTPWTFSRIGAADLFPGAGQIFTIAYDRERGYPVVGGQFTSIAGATASHIAHWNGTSWQPLNAPLDGAGLNGPVYTLRSLPNGNGGLGSGLYVGGNFTAGVNDVLQLHNIARYNGFGFNALGGSLSARGLRGGPVREIRANAARTRLLMAGGFHTAGESQIVNGVAQWDGASWFGLDDVGAGIGIDPSPTALDEVNGRIVVGGTLTHSGTLALNHVAFYQSGGWRTMDSAAGSGLVGNGFLGVSEGSPPQLIGGDAVFLGEINRVGTQSTSNAVRWDAALDALLPVVPSAAGIPEFSRGCADPGDRVLHVFQSAISNPFAGAGISGPHAVLNLTTMALTQGSGQHADRCVVSGVSGVVYSSRFDSAAGTTQIRAFDPATGISTPIGVVSGTVAAMAFDEAGLALYIGGALSNVSGVGAANAARYDVRDGVWSSLGGPEAGFGLNASVTAIGLDAARSDYVYFAGRFTSAGGFPQPAVARWNAATSNWVPMADFCASLDNICPSVLLDLRALQPVGTDSVIVGGNFDSVDGGRSLLAFDGSVWGDAFDGGVFDRNGDAPDVTRLHLDDDLLVVTGFFVGTGHDADSRIAGNVAVFRISADPPPPSEPLIFRNGLE